VQNRKKRGKKQVVKEKKPNQDTLIIDGEVFPLAYFSFRAFLFWPMACKFLETLLVYVFVSKQFLKYSKLP